MRPKYQHQAAVAVAQVDDNLDDATICQIIDAVDPIIRAQVAKEIRAGVNDYAGQLVEHAARIAERTRP